jgi:hypothetical protein
MKLTVPQKGLKTLEVAVPQIFERSAGYGGLCGCDYPFEIKFNAAGA